MYQRPTWKLDIYTIVWSPHQASRMNFGQFPSPHAYANSWKNEHKQIKFSSPWTNSVPGFLKCSKGKGSTWQSRLCLFIQHPRCYIFLNLRGESETANKELIFYSWSQHILGTLFQVIEDYMSSRTVAVCSEGHLLQDGDREVGVPHRGILNPAYFNILMNYVSDQ